MKDLEERIKQLAHWMFESNYLVVFTGAGISTESGLPDFRGPDGIWTRQEKGLPPKTRPFASVVFFREKEGDQVFHYHKFESPSGFLDCEGTAFTAIVNRPGQNLLMI